MLGAYSQRITFHADDNVAFLQAGALVGAPGLGVGGREIVINPEIGGAGIFVLQYVEQLVLRMSRLAKRERGTMTRRGREVGLIFIFSSDWLITRVRRPPA